LDKWYRSLSHDDRIVVALDSVNKRENAWMTEGFGPFQGVPANFGSRLLHFEHGGRFSVLYMRSERVKML